VNAKRSEYAAKMKVKINRWNDEDERKQNKANKLKADDLVQYHVQFAELVEKRREPGSSMSVLQKAREAAWEDVKVGVDIVRLALVESIQAAQACSEQLAVKQLAPTTHAPHR
jgi:hypothetical protein